MFCSLFLHTDACCTQTPTSPAPMLVAAVMVVPDDGGDGERVLAPHKRVHRPATARQVVMDFRATRTLLISGATVPFAPTTTCPTLFNTPDTFVVSGPITSTNCAPFLGVSGITIITTGSNLQNSAIGKGMSQTFMCGILVTDTSCSGMSAQVLEPIMLVVTCSKVD